MVGALLQLGLAAVLIVLIVAGAIVYAARATRQPGWWRLPLAIAFTLGCALSLIPLAFAFLYAPPWDLTLRSKDVAANLDLFGLAGSLLVIGGLAVEIWRAIWSRAGRNPPLATADMLIFYGAIVTTTGVSLGSNLALDPLIRSQPDFAAQEASTWWLMLLWLLAGIVMLVVGQWKLSTTSSAASTLGETGE